MGPMNPGAHRSLSAVAWVFAAIVGMLILSGCGPLGDDDEPEEPPVTVEPTGDSMSGTPASDQDTAPEATPAVDRDITDDSATPADDGEVDAATPDSQSDQLTSTNAGAEPGRVASPISGRGEGDGTSGATPALSSVAGTSEDGLDVEGDATAETSETVSVSSCDPQNIPEFRGESDAFVVTEDLNFRVGPGSDCESIGEGPLIAGEELTVVSDPVVREGESDALWVQVDVGGQLGWVAAEFIEPLP